MSPRKCPNDALAAGLPEVGVPQLVLANHLQEQGTTPRGSAHLVLLRATHARGLPPFAV